MNEKIFIFDIDGTILPDIIKDNPKWDQSDDDLLNAKQIVNEIVEEGSRTELFPGFVDYFKSRCRRGKIVYFVTGREKEYFFGLTVFQLIPIHEFGKNIEIIFYPLGQSFDSKTYHGWKTKTIKSIIKKHKNDAFFYIYDDRTEYFKNFSKKKNVYCFNVIDGESFWFNLL